MDEFDKIAAQHTTEAFQNLTKAVKSMTPEQEREYANKFPVAIWMVAGPSKDHAIAISVN